MNGAKIYFFYSDEGLIGEYGSAGNEIKTYGYEPDSTWSTNPLFQRIGATYYWYQNDHLGTPQKILDATGKIVWSAIYDAFGNIQITTAEIENNLRFPGQYFDSETGLHYNWNRYYDPRTGRYVTQDPLGLEGGINLYIYTLNNPGVNFDYDGQIAWGGYILKCVINGLVGAVTDVFFQEARCCWKQFGWQILQCKCRDCPPINKCSVAVSAVLGCAAGFITGPAPTTLAGIKILLAKWGAKGVLKFLAELGC